jgi:hypothetical protein
MSKEIAGFEFEYYPGSTVLFADTILRARDYVDRLDGGLLDDVSESQYYHVFSPVLRVCVPIAKITG